MELDEFHTGNKEPKFHLAGSLDAPLKIQGYNTTNSHTASATRCLLGYLFTWILLEDPRQ